MSPPGPTPAAVPSSVESWLAPARVVGALFVFAAGAGVSWAGLSAKAESAQQSAASANAAVQRLGESMGRRVDALEASTSARLAAIELKQQEAREGQIRLELGLQNMNTRTEKMDGRLEVILDRLGTSAARRGSRSANTR